MKTVRTIAILLLILGGARLAAQKKEPAEVQLKAAIQKETIDGDLRGAIDALRRIIDGFPNDRPVVANALLHMAECHRKLGDAEAQRILERLVRDFADQREIVAQARARLGAAAGPSAAGSATALHKVWSGPQAEPGGGISPDGRLLTFMDWATGDLAIHDFATGLDRRLTNKGTWLESSALAEESVVSRDGKYVAYAWCDCDTGYELRIIGVGGQTASPARVLYRSDEVAWIAPFDWSPDGKRVAVQIRRRDHRTSQIGWVGVDDGSLRVLKSVEWSISGKLVFSRDGRYLAYDLPVGDGGQRDVFLLAVDGSREVALGNSPGRDAVIGWSPDGARLLFASDRSGTTGLWAQVVTNGNPVGSPELIKSDVGHVGQRPLGISAAGTLFLGTPVGGVDVYVATLDLSTGRALTPPSRTGEMLVGFNRQPDWSPDGKLLAYVSSRGRNGRDTTAIAIDESGKRIRDLQVPLTYAEFPRWAPDGRSLVAYGWDLKGGLGIFRIDAQTGATTMAVNGDFHGPQMSSDGTRMYATLYGDGVHVIDVASGKSEALLRRGNLGTPALSPDGRLLAVRSNDRATKSSAILLVAVDSREVKELYRLTQPESIEGNSLSWTADGRAVIARKAQSGRPAEMWLLPVGGEAPKKLDIASSMNAGPVRVHPDNRRIAFSAGQNEWEIWALENFLTR
jgi:Tol biopolymer transport system component